MDPTLQRMAWSEEQVNAYAEAAARLCHCEGLCVCGWDEPDTLAMLHIEAMPGKQVKNWKQYEALRRKGMSKTSAATHRQLEEEEAMKRKRHWSYTGETTSAGGAAP